jgi:hypothetical protein
LEDLGREDYGKWSAFLASTLYGIGGTTLTMMLIFIILLDRWQEIDRMMHNYNHDADFYHPPRPLARN